MMAIRHSSLNHLQTPISKKELSDISDQISQMYAPVEPIESTIDESDKSISAAQLLEVSKNISLYYASKISLNNKKLVLLPVDPQHLYVYWCLGENQSKSWPYPQNASDLQLRIYSQAKKSGSSKSIETVYTMDVNSPQARQRIHLPVVTESSKGYAAVIGKKKADNDFVELLHSNAINAVKGRMDYSHQRAEKQNIFSPLSGRFNNTCQQNAELELLWQPDRRLLDSCYAASNHSGKGKHI